MIRYLFTVMTAFILAGCSENSATVRYKVIVQAEVDGKMVEGSSVMEIKYTLTPGSLHGYGASTRAKGEATVLDLGERGKLFVIPRTEKPDGSFGHYYEHALLSSLGIKGGVGNLNDAKLDILRSIRIGQKFNLDYFDSFSQQKYWPIMLTLRDLNDPATVTEVTRNNFSRLFGVDVLFQGIKIEITDTPVTTGILEQHLPLLKDRSRTWSQMPRNVPTKSLPPMSEQPFNWRIGRKRFYTEGSW